MADTVDRVLFGYRDDVDLSQRWWHRLAKVVYICLMVLAALFAVTALFDTAPEPSIRNTRFTGVLSEVLKKADPSVPNVVPAFMLLPGKLGLLRDNGAIEYVSEMGVEETWCTPDAIRHLQATTQFLQTRGRGIPTTATVLDGIKRVSQESSPRLCWPGAYLTQGSWDRVVKYEFLPTAARNAMGRFALQALGWMFIAHIVIANLYHRGFVYIVCGPRKKVGSAATS